MGSFVSSTSDERQEMLEFVGCDSFKELFSVIPSEVLFKKPLDLPNGMGEQGVYRKMAEIADKNIIFKSIFRGAGAYNHYIPAIVKSVTGKEEFVTAYTPYQAEISQGLLQSIFEYQTMICNLTGMDVSNASVYDGATAAAEATVMCKTHNRAKVLVSSSTNPEIIKTIKTYCYGSDTPFCVVPIKDGVTDKEALSSMLDDSVSCFYMQQPNFFGIIEDTVSELVHKNGSKFIIGCNPISLGILKTPSELGADIAVGEGQPLGMPLSYGGPYLGFMACKKEMLRRLPGRIVGQTNDGNGKCAFVLTMQAREQHIRREKALSNICSNEALCALTASIYLCAMGKEGLEKIGLLCISKAHYMAQKLCGIKGLSLKYKGEFFNEFFIKCARTDAVLKALEYNGILGGLPMDDGILWCVTEQNSKEDIDKAVSLIEEVCR